MGSRKSLRERAAELLQRFEYASKRCREEKKYYAETKAKAEAATEAQSLVQAVAVGVQKKAHEQIAKIVTRCLRSVFVEKWEFKIIFERKRGKTEARFAFYLNEQEFDPREGSAGGVIDVAAFGLRLACLLLQRPKRRLVLIADEPFKNINGRDNQERAGAMLEALAEETGVQMIIVSDDPWLNIGKVIDIEKA